MGGLLCQLSTATTLHVLAQINLVLVLALQNIKEE